MRAPQISVKSFGSFPIPYLLQYAYYYSTVRGFSYCYGGTLCGLGIKYWVWEHWKSTIHSTVLLLSGLDDVMDMWQHRSTTRRTPSRTIGTMGNTYSYHTVVAQTGSFWGHIIITLYYNSCSARSALEYMNEAKVIVAQYIESLKWAYRMEATWPKTR